MPKIHPFRVVPSLHKTGSLSAPAYNTRWAWHHATVELFRGLDGTLEWRSADVAKGKMGVPAQLCQLAKLG